LADTHDPQLREQLQLGLFMPNCSNSVSISTYKAVPDDWTFESNKAIALAAENAGFDLLFPVSRWRGFGGETNYLGTSLETMTWAASLLASTERIAVYSTVHVPVFHPLVTAKMGATLDHIGKGRWGLNVVSGWSKEEFGMMGIDILPHAERYQRTRAYVEILRGLWSAEPGTFNHRSPWYQITDGYVMPQPNPQPPIANAGVSEEAKEMVAELCDWSFISLRSIESAGEVTNDIKNRAQTHKRRVRCACYPFVLWRETEREAEEERQRIVDHVDRVAVANWANGLAMNSGSFDRFTLEMFALGAGAIPVIGTAEQVAEKLARLHRSGIDAVLMCFFDYLKDTVRFRDEILPLLEQLGTRDTR
jgi:FMNH2-dependent dimethyl sulfone monooxygenase